MLVLYTRGSSSIIFSRAYIFVPSFVEWMPNEYGSKPILFYYLSSCSSVSNSSLINTKLFRIYSFKSIYSLLSASSQNPIWIKN